MRTPAVVATVVLLAGIGPGVAAGGPVSPHAEAGTAVESATAQADAQNDTAVRVETLTIAELRLTGVDVGDARLDDLTLAGGADESAESLGTATARNLTVANATLSDVRFENVTVRNETVATALFGADRPENDTVERDTVTLSNLSVASLLVGDTRVANVSVGTAEAAISPPNETEEATESIERPTVGAENLTVGTATLDSIAADGVTFENGTVGVGSLPADPAAGAGVDA
ncbi:hypothetical protein [Halorussus marinus]|uniref:hypothetical protein n=1 Tax=Halorussus marinus TaxID=2505976 RepID=UPI001092F1D4|nr:hypothetical protein [Halorussus marinus]